MITGIAHHIPKPSKRIHLSKNKSGVLNPAKNKIPLYNPNEKGKTRNQGIDGNGNRVKKDNNGKYAYINI